MSGRAAIGRPRSPIPLALGEEVTVIIVTHNSGGAIRSCLASLGPGLCRIVLVDNASHDDTLRAVAKATCGVDVVRLRHNVGYSRASNLALGMTRTPCALLLNPDARITPKYRFREHWHRAWSELYFKGKHAGKPIARRVARQRLGSLVLTVVRKFPAALRRQDYGLLAPHAGRTLGTAAYLCGLPSNFRRTVVIEGRHKRGGR